jgi:hypothetical protein
MAATPRMAEEHAVPAPKQVPPTPEAVGGDNAHVAAKAAISLVPILGGSLAELFQLVVQPPLEQRRNEWMEEIGGLIQELLADEKSLDDLQENEEFISAVMHASQIALRNHQVSKRNALRNSLNNIALGQSPEEAVQHIFLDLIDTLSELHVRILRVFHSPSAPSGLSVGGISSVLEANIPDLRGKRELYDQFWRDLYLRGLLNTDDAHFTMTLTGLSERRTTRLGGQFMEFIS